jgi:hypothetical protein
MISRQQFGESSHWHLRFTQGGEISMRWLKQEDGSYKARLVQHASVVDRNYKSAETVLGAHDAYERIIAAIGRFVEPILAKQLEAEPQIILRTRVGMLPVDKNPFELQLGTGKSGEGFLVASREVPGRIMIVTTPETQYDPGKKAVFIEISKTGNGWEEVPLSHELVEVAKTYYAPWMKKALAKIEPAPAASFAA